MRRKNFIFALILAAALLLLMKATHGQGVTNEKAQRILGQKFISCKEAGIEEIPILYGEKELIEDSTSWLVPINFKNEFRYILLKTKYITSDLQQYEANMFSEVEIRRILVFVYKFRKSFPNLNNAPKYDGYVFMSKDIDPYQSKRSLKFGIPLKICVFYNEGISTLSVPENVSKVLADSDSFVYTYRNKKGESASGGGGSNDEENYFYPKGTREQCLKVIVLTK